MIVPDLDLLIYAYNEGNELHRDARTWWEGLANGTEPVGMPWQVSDGFIRQMANPRILAEPWTPAAVTRVVAQWFGSGHVIPLTLNLKHRGGNSTPWVIYHTANGDTEAGRDAAAMVAELKSLDLWPHHEHELFSLRQHSGNHLPVWLTRVPTREEPDTGQIPGLLNGLVICHTCNALMNHQKDDQGRYYKCPTTVLDPSRCRNRHKDAPRLEWLAANRVTFQAQAVLTFLELALSAEQTDDPADQLAMNRALANSEIDELRETLQNAGPAHRPDLVQQTQQEADALLTRLQSAAAEGSSPGQAIWDITDPRGPISPIRLRDHAARALTANLTQANIDLVRRYLVCIDPERENMTLRPHPHLSAGYYAQPE